MSALKVLWQSYSRFRRDESGTATVEAVLWVPMFLVFCFLVIDVSFAFHRQTQALTVVQDANRALSVGRVSSLDEMNTLILDRLSGLSANAEVVSAINDGIVSSVVQIPVEDLVVVGMFGFLTDFPISVTSQHFIEN